MRTSFESLLKTKNMAHLGGPQPGQPAKAQRVAFLLLDHFSMMAFTGAVDALVTANLMSPSPLYQVQVVSVSGQRALSDLGIEVATDCNLEHFDDHALDMLVVCGGYRVKLQSSALIRSRLKSAASHAQMLGGLWNGAYFLAEAGLLDGYQCAFHPDGRAVMSEDFPRTQLSSRSFVVDRDRMSCAGANSSLGMMLEVVRRSFGDGFVSAIDEVLGCDKLQEVLDVSVVAIDRNPTLPQALKLTLELMSSNIDEPLSMDEIARCADISRRHLERLFMRHMNASPTRYYMELRMTRARQLLLQTNKSMAEIAVATGFVSIAHFQRCFREFFQVAPGRLRKSAQARLQTWVNSPVPVGNESDDH
ncbi:GlxA family transcriptional regulator [Pseudomonas sp. R5(2019)]|uniref:GlxA family transcriptional regulator n=1 Tax=Pseudomonas sp. R5(2019) TaxID=2697566 RepID=UPI0014121DBD|nr:GlxA family transcriptional regulator [Pseudomonas sp. R5(2019)]NBA98179.1 helix-turn-helix domain-containing protein [Pseudomonas sp. R5(2019)]